MKKNYTPKTMSFMDGYNGPKGNVGFQMEADYEKAKEVLDKILSKRKDVERATMGLDGDYEINSTTIYDGENHYPYDAHPSSQWAEPIIIIEFTDGSNEAYPVWTRTITV